MARPRRAAVSLCMCRTPTRTCTHVHRHRRRCVNCTGTGVPVLKLTASAGSFQRCAAHAERMSIHMPIHAPIPHAAQVLEHGAPSSRGGVFVDAQDSDRTRTMLGLLCSEPADGTSDVECRVARRRRRRHVYCGEAVVLSAGTSIPAYRHAASDTEIEPI